MKRPPPKKSPEPTAVAAAVAIHAATSQLSTLGGKLHFILRAFASLR